MLLKTAKRFVSIVRTHSLHLNHTQRARTVFRYFVLLRSLLRWMEAEGYARFADLDAAALRRFQRSIARRKNNRGATVTAHTVKHYLNVLVYLFRFLFRFRDQLDDGLSIDPCPGQSAYELAGTSGSVRHHSPATPDEVAVPLIQGAIDLLESAAIDVSVADLDVLIDGFQSPLGMELLATVDWQLQKEAAAGTVEGIRASLAQWPGGNKAGQRKLRLFDDRMIGLALTQLTTSPLYR